MEISDRSWWGGMHLWWAAMGWTAPFASSRFASSVTKRRVPSLVRPGTLLITAPSSACAITPGTPSGLLFSMKPVACMMVPSERREVAPSGPSSGREARPIVLTADCGGSSRGVENELSRENDVVAGEASTAACSVWLPLGSCGGNSTRAALTAESAMWLGGAAAWSEGVVPMVEVCSRSAVGGAKGADDELAVESEGTALGGVGWPIECW